MKILFAILLILHGFIVSAQSSVSFKPAGGTPNPSWLKGFPVNRGQSWLFVRLGLENSAAVKAIGILWIIAGVALIASALGVLGFIIPFTWWRTLALIGAIISLALLVLYFHPFYLIGFSASLLLLLALVLKNWNIFSQIGL